MKLIKVFVVGFLIFVLILLPLAADSFGAGGVFVKEEFENSSNISTNQDLKILNGKLLLNSFSENFTYADGSLPSN